VVAGHASINQAAQALGIWPSSLYTQLASLERACGGPLIRRSPRPPGTAALTPLGQLLCQQASEYLGLQRTPGPPAVRDTAAGQAAAPARPVRVAQAQVRGDAERAMVSSQ
jgi:molybdenum-dependent DNA-binding transcriptional regulator ModE